MYNFTDIVVIYMIFYETLYIYTFIYIFACVDIYAKSVIILLSCYTYLKKSLKSFAHNKYYYFVKDILRTIYK